MLMKRIIGTFIILVCIVCFIAPAFISIDYCSAYDAYDDSKAIERDSKSAQKEAEKENYGSAREDAGKGFDTPTSPSYDPNEYDIPMPGEPQVDNE